MARFKNIKHYEIRFALNPSLMMNNRKLSVNGKFILDCGIFKIYLLLDKEFCENLQSL